MTDYNRFTCDAQCSEDCKETDIQRDWIAHYDIVYAADTTYHKPKERQYHACLPCYDEYYGPEDEINYPPLWCSDYIIDEYSEIGNGRKITGALFPEHENALRSNYEFVPRSELTYGQMKVVKFLEEEVL